MDGYDDIEDDLSISCVPNALLLYNPVIDNGLSGFGFDRIGMDYKKFSPLHNLKRNMPPAIFFLGSEDNLIPVETAKYFQKSMFLLGTKCELYIKRRACFFNKLEYKPLMISLTDKLLCSLNW